MTVVISAFANTPEGALATRQWLLDDLGRQLHDLQKVNGADDRFLFTALPVDVAREPVEKVSSRLRSLIVTLGAGAILVMGVVSVAAALDRRRKGRAGAPGWPLYRIGGDDTAGITSGCQRESRLRGADIAWRRISWMAPLPNRRRRYSPNHLSPNASADEPVVKWDSYRVFKNLLNPLFSGSLHPISVRPRKP